jgi:hypothetical protein
MGNYLLVKNGWASKQKTQMDFVKHLFCKGMDRYYLFEYLLGGMYALLFPIVETYRKLTTSIKLQYSRGKKIFRIVRTSQFRSRLKSFVASNNKSQITSLDQGYLNFSRVIPTSQPPKYILLIPNLTLPVYGGIATALRFAHELYQNGNRVRISTISDSSNISRVELLEVAKSLNIEQEAANEIFGDISNLTIEISEGDILIATAWWTEVAGRNAINSSGFQNCEIIYFIQDFECLFYPAGSDYAAALETYSDADFLLVNSVPLANYLSENIVSESMSSQRSITFQPEHLFKHDVVDYPVTSDPEIGPIRILLYGRPSTPRNLFELAIKSLDKITTVNKTKSFEIISVGELHEDVTLSTGIKVKSLGALSGQDYKIQISEADIGLSLMLSPHPSYPPLEMAALGLTTVSNDFLGYKKAYLSSMGIHVAEPSLKSIVAKLQELIDSMCLETIPPIIQERANPLRVESETKTLSEIALTLTRIYPILNRKNE